MTTLLAFLFVLGVLVFVHELGHFLLARWNGVRVLTFSLGFGPKLLKVQRGDTEYCISIIPLGGYVKMAGENPDDPRTGGDDEFLAKSKWQRFQILIAGPAMNLMLAVGLLALVLMQGAEVLAFLDRPAVVGAVEPGSPAERSGVQPGDVIVRVGSADVATWEQLDMAVAARPERDVDLVVMRGGREERLSIRPDLTELRCGLVVAVHRKYLEDDQTRTAIQRTLDTPIEVPPLTSANAIARVLGSRVHAHTDSGDASITAVVSASAVDRLFDHYQRGLRGELLGVVGAVHIALAEACDDGAELIGPELIDDAITVWDPT